MTCAAPLRSGNKCKLDLGHKGRHHGGLTFRCGGCEKVRRLSQLTIHADPDPDWGCPDLCWFCTHLALHRKRKPSPGPDAMRWTPECEEAIA